LRILVLAYACGPGEGSEPGTGWMWSRLLARLGEATVITRTNNRHAIEEALATTPEASRLRFVYVDLPRWARSWKRGQRGVRLYYLLWQLAVLRAARRLHRGERFDLVWHVTLSNYWLGSVGGLIGAPFLFGPVGGGVASCLDVRLVGFRGLIYEIARSLARAVNEVANPLVRSALRRSSVVLVNNPDTAARLPAGYRAKSHLFPHVLLDNVKAPDHPRGERPRVALFAGRLLPWKGAALAMRAVARLPGWRLIVCGEGPDRDRLLRLRDRLRLGDLIELRGWVPRDELHGMMRREASVFLFPSLHEEGGWVVAEAAANGLSVVCLDRGGPAVLAGVRGVPIAGLTGTVNGLVRSLREGVREARSSGERRAWNLDSREQELVGLLNRVGIDLA
jgi:glycosyltransferase involved in cell wall biosynthesis